MAYPRLFGLSARQHSPLRDTKLEKISPPLSPVASLLDNIANAQLKIRETFASDFALLREESY